LSAPKPSDPHEHVFYTVVDGGPLRVVSLVPGGTFTYATVDGGSGVAMGSWSAPVLQSGMTQVYYTDDTHGVIRGATLHDGVWTWKATIDGGTAGSSCASGGGGATTHFLTGALSGVIQGPGPHLFYRDTVTNDLREAWYD
jgi:hypothetical protein